MLVEAGLTPLEALTAATLTPARMLRLDDAIGTVEPGKLADLVIVDSDPLDDVTVLRTPRVVIRDGVAGTPEQWSTPAP